MAELEVSGGAGGVMVALDDVLGVARRLDRVADELVGLGLEVLRCQGDPELLAVAPFAPVEAGRVHLALHGIAGPAGLPAEVARVRALADSLRWAVRSYRSAEDAAETASDLVGTAVGVAAGAALPGVASVAALGAGAVVAGAVVAGAGPLAPALVAVGVGAVRSHGEEALTSAGEGVDRFLFAHPGVTQPVVDSLEGLVVGVGLGAPLVGAYLAAQGARVGAAPTSQEGALRVVIAAGAGRVLDESGHRVVVTPLAPVVTRRPSGVAELVSNDGPVAARGQSIRVVGIPQPGGGWAWTVDVPGTRTFTASAGPDPFDSTSNGLLEAKQRTLTMAAADHALTDAKARVGGDPDARRQDPVLTHGHSQGGITAAALAASPTFRANHPGLTHVVTTGAPVARLEVPATVRALSLEHRQDLVPGLDGADNPDRRGWVTVRRDVGDELASVGRASAAHADGVYAATGALVDASTDPSIRGWRAGTEVFLGKGPAADLGDDRQVIAFDYHVERVRR